MLEASATICGTCEAGRTTVIQKLWEYIKGNELQNPADKREILCDALCGGILVNVVDARKDKCGELTMDQAYLQHAISFAQTHGWTPSIGSCASRGYSVRAGKSTPAPATSGYSGTPLHVVLYTKSTNPYAASVALF